MAGYFPIIGRIHAQICSVRLLKMFRVIHRSFAANPLDAVPSPSRFSDPSLSYAVMYGAETVSCCLWEAVVRNSLTRRPHRVIPRSVFALSQVVEFKSTQDLRLVDLQDDGPIWIGAPLEVVHESNHHEGRSLSEDVYSHLQEADGFLYSSRYTGHVCCAIFDRAIMLKLATVSDTPLNQHPDLGNTLSDYDITSI